MTGVLPPLAGFFLFAAAMVLGSILTLIVGLVGLIVTRARAGRPTRPGRSSAWRAVAIGGVLLLTLGGARQPIRRRACHSRHHHRSRRSAAVRVQRGHRRQTGPRSRLPAGPARFDRAAEGGLSRPRADPARRAGRRGDRSGGQSGRSPGLARSSASTKPTDASKPPTPRVLFRFVDDIVVRIRTAPGGSIVDVRSTSRVGESDLGANAARIRAFREHLVRNG